MKLKILLLLLFFPLIISAQIHFNNFVQCVFDNKSDAPLIIYDKIDGNEVLKLKTDEKICWYKLIVEKSENGWLKIHKLIGIADCSSNKLIKENDFHKGYWVNADNFYIFSFFQPINNKNTIKFYEKLSLKSLIVVKIDIYTKYQIIETHNLWAKVSFKYKNKKYIGWIHRYDQCANPWTSC